MQQDQDGQKFQNIGESRDEIGAAGDMFVHLPHWDLAPEDCCYSQELAHPGVAGRHHVGGGEHLGHELGNGQPLVAQGAAGSQGREPGHKEVEAGEGDHVDCQLAKVGVELTGEPEAGGHARHGEGDEVIEIPVGRCGQLQGPETDVVQCLQTTR